MADFAAITSTISGAVGVLKEVGSLAKKAGNHELNQRIIDLQSRIIEIQAQLTELANENEALKRRNLELSHISDVVKELQYEESVYWRVRDGKRIDGPFCPTCLENDQKVIHLAPGATKGTYSCSTGKHGDFWTAEHRNSGTAIDMVSRPSLFQDAIKRKL